MSIESKLAALPPAEREALQALFRGVMDPTLATINATNFYFRELTGKSLTHQRCNEYLAAEHDMGPNQIDDLSIVQLRQLLKADWQRKGQPQRQGADGLEPLAALVSTAATAQQPGAKVEAPQRRKGARRNEARDKWIAKQREKNPPTPWEEIFDKLIEIADGKKWAVPSSAKSLTQAYYTHQKARPRRILPLLKFHVVESRGMEWVYDPIATWQIDPCPTGRIARCPRSPATSSTPSRRQRPCVSSWPGRSPRLSCCAP